MVARNPKARKTSERGGITPADWKWIQRVAAGERFDEAVGSNAKDPRIRHHLAAAFLATPAVRAALVSHLLMLGDSARAEEVLRYAAALSLDKALREGDTRASLALMARAPPKPAKRSTPAVKIGGESVRSIEQSPSGEPARNPAEEGPRVMEGDGAASREVPGDGGSERLK